MNNKNNNSLDNFPFISDPEFDSIVMEHEMTGAIPIIDGNIHKAYGEGSSENQEPPYGKSKGKGKGTSNKK